MHFPRGALPNRLPGSHLRPLSSLGHLYQLEVDEGLFLDRPEQQAENVTVAFRVATCGDFNFSCQAGQQLVENATLYRQRHVDVLDIRIPGVRMN